MDLGDLAAVAAWHDCHGAMNHLGTGMDFDAYRCDDLVLRVPRRAEVAAQMDTEYACLAALPLDLPLEVPRPLGPPGMPLGPDRRVLAYRIVPGTPLCDLHGPVDRVPVGAALGRFLQRLHTALPHEVTPSAQISAWVAEAPSRLLDVADRLDADVVAATTRALGQPLPPVRAEPVMCHRDLSEEHVLLDASGNVTGVIDFGDAGPSPWWHDLVRIWTWGGDPVLAATCHAYGRDLRADERVLLEHLAVTGAVWDVAVAARSNDRQAFVSNAQVLRRVLRLR